MLSKLKKLNQKDQKGFTIIEVLIVLAIAGLILLIVFLAVPALQRNSRNTQRKNDAAALLGGLSEYANNNSGQLPGAVTVVGGIAYFCTSGTCTANDTPAKLGFYNTGTVTMQTTVPTGTLSTDTVYVLKGFTCSGNTPTAGSARGVVAYFAIEPNATAQCQAS